MLKSSFFALCLLFSVVFSDVYMHMPRGSNDRLDEANNNRNNANRLFDSQNNNRGGYNVGWHYYYVNSQMMFQWTNQHSSNSDKITSEFIIQMLCQEQAPGLRDGTTTDTIPDDPILSNGIRFGQHETYTYYQKCKNRQRNLGLFTADQLNPNDQGRRGARFTRQNENGNRYGFECPEERDYYPYWAPSPWIDVAILTSDMSRCNYYLNESQNVKGRYECSVMYYNNRDDCVAGGGEWTLVPANGFDAPLCAPACYSRDNHLGDSVDNLPCHINISIPNYVSKRCVFRLRYNMSSDDADWWNLDSRNNTQPAGESPLIAHQYPTGDPTTLYWVDNPEVDIGIGVKLQLNLNTNQYGRTFQDRTHFFEIRNRPASLRLAKIWNLNVRGKRGNIVQTYPAVEYDFVPNRLHARRGDYVHLAWTGSSTNDNGNDGQGKEGTDRSNFLQMYHSKKNFPMHMDNVTLFDRDTAVRLAILTPGQQGGEVSQMDDAGTYFDAGLIELKKGGEFYYLSTRNNAFSNRDQKGVIIVSGVATSSYTAAVHARNAAIAVSVSLVGIIAVAVVAVILFVTIHGPTRNAILNRLRALGKKKNAAAAPAAVGENV